MRLRAQLLVALFLVTVGGIASIGAIALWQARQALVAERYQHVAVLTAAGGRLAETALVGLALDDPAARARLADAAPELQRALGADELVFYDAAGEPLLPAAPPPLAADGPGLAAALAGAPPHPAAHRPRALVAYAPVGGERIVGALRASFPLDAAVDAALGPALRSLLVLGALDALVLLGAAAWLLGTAIVRPVRALERAARRVAAGDLGARVELRGPGELATLADAFDRMTTSLRAGRESLIRSEKLAGVGRLAAGVAHEVGNPLAAILGYVETLLGDTPDRPIPPALRREILERVRGETERIHRIIQELLEYSRPPRDEVGAVDVARAVDAAVSLVTAQARLRGRAIRVRLPDDLPAVTATPGRLTQVLLNLLLNAGDATAAGGTIQVDGRVEDDGQVVIGVADDGAGVAPEIREQIFEPFFTTKDPGAGTGLGLSISLAIVEGYGGTLRLVDAGPTGARFEVVLPAARAQAGSAKSAS